MTDEQKGHEEEAEVEAHRQAHPRQSHPMGDDDEAGKWSRADDDDDEDEVEAHRWGNHSPEDPGMRS